MTTYITTTFTPAMMDGNGSVAMMKEISLEKAKEIMGLHEWKSAVSHENTAELLSRKLSMDIAFNRVNISLDAGDTVICIIPAFRTNVAREFTDEEIRNAEFRAFVVNIISREYADSSWDICEALRAR